MDIPTRRDTRPIARTQEDAGGPPGWRFPHPTRGTCIPSCPSLGRCHCGCGGRPKLSTITVEPSGRVAGRPFVFVSGHQLRVVHPRAGGWSRNGVSVERIRPLLRWLRTRHGSMRVVAILLEMPEATIRGYAYNTKRKRIPPHAARRIAGLVLAHRKATGILDVWEEQPGLRPFAHLLPPAARAAARSARRHRA